jgi:hypothetical protein
MLSMESFVNAIERAGGAVGAAAPGENPFQGIEPLPSSTARWTSWCRRPCAALEGIRPSSHG